mmetsp:Transcript_1413/g.3252  ORF Transcript_1413/g.3252 Transcript_1413/m.3252 type:complete len:459 (-) Transcript_1413:46-1422(-)
MRHSGLCSFNYRVPTMKLGIVRVTSFLVVLLSIVSLVSCFAQSNAQAGRSDGSGQGFGKKKENGKAQQKNYVDETASVERRYLEPFGLELVDNDGYRSVRTIEDRPEGEILLEIPLQDTLTVDTIKSELATCSEIDNVEDQEEALALGLLALKNAEDPYVSRVFPKSHHNVWTMPKSLWNIWKSALPRCYFETFGATRQRISKFATNAAESNAQNIDDLLWAFSMVRSRSLAVPELATDQENIPLALIPGLDLLNHEFGSTTQLSLDEISQKWVLASSDSINAGKEVFLSYGDDKDNWKLLLNYGFALTDNPNAVVFWSWRDLLDAAQMVRPNTFSERVCQQLMKHPQLTAYTTISEQRATFSYDASTQTPRESLNNGFVLLHSLAAQLGSPESDNGEVLAQEVLEKLIEKRLEELREGQSNLAAENENIDSEWTPFFESLRVALEAEEKQLTAQITK